MHLLRLRFLVLGSLFLGMLFRHVSSHYATADGTEDRVMPRIVARHSTHDRAFEAAGRARRFDC